VIPLAGTKTIKNVFVSGFISGFPESGELFAEGIGGGVFGLELDLDFFAHAAALRDPSGKGDLDEEKDEGAESEAELEQAANEGQAETGTDDAEGEQLAVAGAGHRVQQGRDDPARADPGEHDKEAAATEQTERKKRAAAVEHLVKSVEFEVPASMVMGEARRVVREIVEAEQMRGLSDEDLLSKKEEIFQHAQMGAQFRVKADFILTRLAREQKIEASREELAEHIARMAQRLNMPMDKLVKQLVKREALGSVEGEVVRDKALDFLASKVKVKKAEGKA
jgi:hypothetical protein